MPPELALPCGESRGERRPVEGLRPRSLLEAEEEPLERRCDQCGQSACSVPLQHHREVKGRRYLHYDKGRLARGQAQSAPAERQDLQHIMHVA